MGTLSFDSNLSVVAYEWQDHPQLGKAISRCGQLSLYKPQVHLADLLFLSNQCPVCNTIANGLSTVGHSKMDPHLHQSQFGPSYLVLGQPQLGACRNANLSNQVSMICEVLKCFSKRLAEYNRSFTSPDKSAV